jgi:hypothetical protein
MMQRKKIRTMSHGSIGRSASANTIKRKIITSIVMAAERMYLISKLFTPDLHVGGLAGVLASGRIAAWGNFPACRVGRGDVGFVTGAEAAARGLSTHLLHGL